jgi:hypothetical protein
MLSFSEAWPKLNEAAGIGDEITKEEAEAGIRDGSFSFFSRDNSAALVAAHGDALRIGIAGGDLDELREIEREIYEYARQNNFAYVDIIGRPGWERVLPNYDRVAVLLRKIVCHS